MDFGKVLQEKLGEHQPDEIEELILDNLFNESESLTKNQKDNLEKYKSLIHLSMNGIGIKSLKNMPKIDSLQILELCSNFLTGSDLDIISNLYPALYKLKLENNVITSLDSLKGLHSAKIEKISLEGNPCATDNYKAEVFKMFPGLVSVDAESRDGKAVESTVYEEEEDAEGEDSEGNLDGDEEDEFDDLEEGEEDDEFEDEEDEDEDEDDKPKKKRKQ